MFSNPFFMKQILILIFFLAFGFKHYSQTSLGVKAGINFSKATYLNEYNEQLIDPVRDYKLGFVSGVVLHQQLNKILSVQAEVLYSQKGLKTVQVSHNKTINSMNYLEVPLSGHYSLINNRRNSLNIYIGGYAAYWTDGRYKRTDLATSEVTILNVDFNNPDYEYSRIDAGVLLGFLYKKKKTDIFIRYTHSMTGSSKNNTDALTNRVISVGVNYFIIN